VSSVSEVSSVSARRVGAGDGLEGNVLRCMSLVRRLPYEECAVRGTAGSRRHRALARLRLHVEIARKRSSWWRERFADADLDRIRCGDLSSLPVLTRQQLVEHWEELVTDPCLTARSVSRHLAGPGRQGAMLEGRYHLVKTSGTTGDPLVMPWSAAGWLRMALTALRGVPPWVSGPEAPTSSSKHAPPVAHGAKAPILPRRWQLAGQTGATPVVLAAFGTDARQMSGAVAATWSCPSLRIVPISAAVDAAELLGLVQEWQPVELRGFPSALRRLAVEVLSRAVELPAFGVGASGEQLTPATAALLTAAFGSRPTNAWGATEAGWLAFSDRDPTSLIVADDACILENVDADLRPVGPGRAGSAVLVTPLLNTALPLFRYRIDDSVTVEPAGGRDAVRIHGRGSPVTPVSGSIIRTDVLQDAVERSLPGADYQIVYGSAGLVVEVVGPLDAAGCRTVADRCARTLRGQGTVVPVTAVQADRARLLPSGKAPRFRAASS